MRPELSLVFLLLAGTVAADDSRLEVGGHTKLNVVGQTYPSDSVFRNQFGSHTEDVIGDLRINASFREAGFTATANYQLIGLYGDRFRVPDDSRRYLDLTSVISEGDSTALVHRLDRLWLGYTSEKLVVRAGRQALSWGNGLFYAPMDLVNPFDPATVDTEYKAGDDLIYAQYLTDSGADVQAVHVLRRDLLTGGQQWNVSDFLTKKSVILAGLGWGGMPEHMIQAELESGGLDGLTVDGFPTRHTEIYAIRRRDKPMGRVTSEIWEALKNNLVP